MEDFVTYEQAVKLKELGFDWECNHLYSHRSSIDFNDSCYYHDFNTTDSSKDYSAPTLAQAQKWLREKGISVEPISCGVGNNVNGNIDWSSFICLLKDKFRFDHTATFNSYEDALSEGIDKALQILTDKTEKI